MIKFESLIDDDNFEIDDKVEEDNFNNRPKIVNDIFDEYEFEYNKVKNIYYRKNPFSEESEKNFKKIAYKKYMKLPGIDHLNSKNFISFVENGIYGMEAKEIESLIKLFNDNKIVNIHGKKNSWLLGDELCKYFYMEESFPNGIYIISPRNIDQELNYLIKNIKISVNENSDCQTLILFKLFEDNEKDEQFKNIISSLQIKGIHIIICSQNEIKLENVEILYMSEKIFK